MHFLLALVLIFVCPGDGRSAGRHARPAPAGRAVGGGQRRSPGSGAAAAGLQAGRPDRLDRRPADRSVERRAQASCRAAAGETVAVVVRARRRAADHRGRAAALRLRRPARVAASASRSAYPKEKLSPVEGLIARPARVRPRHLGCRSAPSAASSRRAASPTSPTRWPTPARPTTVPAAPPTSRAGPQQQLGVVGVLGARAPRTTGWCRSSASSRSAATSARCRRRRSSPCSPWSTSSSACSTCSRCCRSTAATSPSRSTRRSRRRRRRRRRYFADVAKLLPLTYAVHARARRAGGVDRSTSTSPRPLSVK